jgi:hypothetical protein
MGLLQWIGLFILLVSYAAMLAILIFIYWPTGPASWWRKLIAGFWVYFVLWSAVVVIILRGNWVARQRDRQKH